MLGYYISQSNQFTIRTEPTASNQLTMSLQDMYLLTNATMSMSGITYNGYESLLAFTASISGAYEGAEYRATLYNQSGSASIEIWNGSMQVYKSSSVGKEEYENQIPPVTSHTSENRYIILD
jgi:hypothetical protein